LKTKALAGSVGEPRLLSFQYLRADDVPLPASDLTVSPFPIKIDQGILCHRLYMSCWEASSAEELAHDGIAYSSVLMLLSGGRADSLCMGFNFRSLMFCPVSQSCWQ
jgi:hypothetical protein